MRTERIIDDPLCEFSQDFLGREEFWKAVPGFEHYEVSTFGRLRKYVTGAKSDDSYTEVSLGDRRGRKKRIRLHQLVMETFVGPAPSGHNINHKDGSKQNARLNNLEHSTFSGNSQHAVDTGLWVPKCLLTDQQIKAIKVLSSIAPQKEVAEIFRISRQHVSNIVLGKRRSRRWEKQDGPTAIDGN